MPDYEVESLKVLQEIASGLADLKADLAALSRDLARVRRVAEAFAQVAQPTGSALSAIPPKYMNLLPH
jgi:hypothetical protein